MTGPRAAFRIPERQIGTRQHPHGGTRLADITGETVRESTLTAGQVSLKEQALPANLSRQRTARTR
ncbi:hypothetical protein GCM10022419_072230 [Nonomuraea rosea]|uniref:Uncharacterized protein n=1 Tax=Nonomuraea rosea TaxID=638574 RepID=A0ABP6YDH4_9ACTN